MAPLEWEEFKESFKIRFLPNSARAMEKMEFETLKQDANMSITEHDIMFVQLSRYMYLT